MTYEAGFAQGERDAYTDRAAGAKSEAPPTGRLKPYQKGYWDAYTPRTATWWVATQRRQLEAA